MDLLKLFPVGSCSFQGNTSIFFILIEGHVIVIVGVVVVFLKEGNMEKENIPCNLKMNSLRRLVIQLC